ncbi:MAG: Unknown protein, partial [uncultured Thiotrichaceae bacterium]
NSMSEKRKHRLQVIDGGKSEAYQKRINTMSRTRKEDPKMIRLDQWRERMTLLFARQRT